MEELCGCVGVVVDAVLVDGFSINEETVSAMIHASVVLAMIRSTNRNGQGGFRRNLLKKLEVDRDL